MPSPALVVKAVEDTFRKIGRDKQANIGKSVDHMHETGTLPTNARGAGSCSTGADVETGADGQESGCEQGADAARMPLTAREFARAVFRFCRVLKYALASTD